MVKKKNAKNNQVLSVMLGVAGVIFLAIVIGAVLTNNYDVRSRAEEQTLLSPGDDLFSLEQDLNVFSKFSLRDDLVHFSNLE